jgi:hypothetical protein
MLRIMFAVTVNFINLFTNVHFSQKYDVQQSKYSHLKYLYKQTLYEHSKEITN